MQVLTTISLLLKYLFSAFFFSPIELCFPQHYRNLLSHMLEIDFPVVFSLSSEKVSYHFSSLLLI